jgi:hypothetical protein
VAELVDARDIKFFAPAEIPRFFCITTFPDTMESDAKRPDLSTAGPREIMIGCWLWRPIWFGIGWP